MWLRVLVAFCFCLSSFVLPDSLGGSCFDLHWCLILFCWGREFPRMWRVCPEWKFSCSFQLEFSILSVVSAEHVLSAFLLNFQWCGVFVGGVAKIIPWFRNPIVSVTDSFSGIAVSIVIVVEWSRIPDSRRLRPHVHSCSCKPTQETILLIQCQRNGLSMEVLCALSRPLSLSPEIAMQVVSN